MSSEEIEILELIKNLSDQIEKIEIFVDSIPDDTIPIKTEKAKVRDKVKTIVEEDSKNKLNQYLKGKNFSF